MIWILGIICADHGSVLQQQLFQVRLELVVVVLLIFAETVVSLQGGPRLHNANIQGVHVRQQLMVDPLLQVSNVPLVS